MMKKILILIMLSMFSLMIFAEVTANAPNYSAPFDHLKSLKKPIIPTKGILLSESFETSVPPAGWEMINMPGAVALTSTGIPWHMYDSYSYDGSYSAVYGHAANADSWLKTARFDLAATIDTAVLSFWWAGSYHWAVINGYLSLKVKISDDYGLTWNTLYDNHDSASVVDHGAPWPYITWAWYNPQIDLSSYIGKTDLIIGFHLVADTGADIHVDLMTIDTFFDAPYDISLNAYVNPTSDMPINNPIAPQVEIGNNFSDSVDAKVGIFIKKDGIVQYSELSNTLTIAPYSSYYHTFPIWSGPDTIGDYEFTSFTIMENDVNHSNDTLIDTFQSYLSWIEISNIGFSVQWSSYCTDGSKFYVIGGIDSSSGTTKHIQVYDPSDNSWDIFTTMPYPVCAGAAAIIDSVLYITNADNSNNADFTYDSTNMAYDMRTGVWEFKTPCPYARMGSGGGVVDGKMYVVGGLNNAAFSTETYTYEYNPEADTIGGTPWTKMTDCPRGADGFALGTGFYGSPDNDYVILGGDYQGSSTTYAYYIYDPSADTAAGTPWKTIAFPDLITAGYVGGKNPRMVWDNNYAYLFGGDYNGGWVGPYTDALAIYDIASDTWVKSDYVMNTGMEGSAAALINNRIYTFGGTTGSGALMPAPFEYTFTVEGLTGDITSPFIASSSPVNSENINQMDMDIIVEFSEPIDYTNFAFNYTVDPNPGNLSPSWNGTNDILTISHNDFMYNVEYNVNIINAYDNAGNSIEIGSDFSFTTAVSNVNELRTKDFSLSVNSLVLSRNSLIFNITGNKDDLSINLYNIAGKFINTISKTNNFIWNFTDINNGKVPNGIYFYTISHKGTIYNGKISVIR